ncbi:MAG: T9SS type A sorting domain-containing protein [Bacteroidetes bacterium]|nr:T9SS type A sorting domain-containing protein [Bacteroidota bacterium]
MKKIIQLTCCLSILLISGRLYAQVSKLANNKNFTMAITLGNKSLLATDKDSVWVTDGTKGGTTKLLSNAITTEQAVVYKNKIYAGVYNAAKGAELWVSDGTTSGTKLFKDINPGPQGSYPINFFVFNNTLFFFAYTNKNGYELWKSNGTDAGTVMVKDIWKGKGSSFDSTASYFFYPANGYLFFLANDSTHGRELWRTDGTGGGTILVKDLNPGEGSFDINSYNALNDRLIFTGKDGNPTGLRVWKSNGTPGGTSVIKTLLPTSSNSSVSALGLSKYEDKLIFAVEGYILAIPNFKTINQLYSTNGTSASLIKDLGDSSLSYFSLTLTPTINNKFYFTTYSNNGSLLWQSNGTSGGTKVTKNIGTSLNLDAGHIPFIITDFITNSPDSANLKNFNGNFFIAADDGVHGYEPWITNGTPGGTKLVKDIYKNSGSSLSLSNFTWVYSQQGLYFTANDNSTGNELWLSDGTGAGTKEVYDINPGSKSSNPRILTILNNHLLISADDGDNSKGLKDLYKVNKTFDTLNLVQDNNDDAAVAAIAPDGTNYTVYPNPAKDQLNIRMNKNISTQKLSLMISDMKGRQVYARELNSNQISASFSIDISKLEQGVYELQIITDKGVSSSRFVKIQ